MVKETKTSQYNHHSATPESMKIRSLNKNNKSLDSIQRVVNKNILYK